MTIRPGSTIRRFRGRTVVWTDQRNDDGDIYGADISDLENIKVFEIVRGAGTQQQPAVDGSLVAYLNGATGSGAIQIACITRNYGILVPEFGAVLYGMGPALDGTFLAGLNSEYGPVMASRIMLGYSIFDGPIENVTTGQTYDYIQHAISDAEDGQVVVVPEGVHHEKINFVGRAITVRSADPSDPAVVAATVLTGGGDIVTFAESEYDSSILDGVTLTGGTTGVFTADAHPTITRCVVAGNRGAGVVLADESEPTFTHCRIVGNRSHGIDMRVTGTSRVRHCQPKLFNCIVAGNGGCGLRSGKPTLTNCTVVQNAGVGLDTGGGTMVNSIVYANGDGEVQIDDTRITVTYCDVQGGRSGTGNLDIDPEFVSLGQWLNGLWIEGDYHLKSEGFRWDASAGQWTTDTVTSACIDAGDPGWALGNEPTTLPDGDSAANERINLGAYGGTVEASLAP